jgi:hypothetical protein
MLDDTTRFGILAQARILCQVETNPWCARSKALHEVVGFTRDYLHSNRDLSDEANSKRFSLWGNAQLQAAKGLVVSSSRKHFKASQAQPNV